MRDLAYKLLVTLWFRVPLSVLEPCYEAALCVSLWVCHLGFSSPWVCELRVCISLCVCKLRVCISLWVCELRVLTSTPPLSGCVSSDLLAL